MSNWGQQVGNWILQAVMSRLKYWVIAHSSAKVALLNGHSSKHTPLYANTWQHRRQKYREDLEYLLPCPHWWWIFVSPSLPGVKAWKSSRHSWGMEQGQIRRHSSILRWLHLLPDLKTLGILRFATMSWERLWRATGATPKERPRGEKISKRDCWKRYQPRESPIRSSYQIALLTTPPSLITPFGRLDHRSHTKWQNLRISILCLAPPTKVSFCNTGLTLLLAITLPRHMLHSQMTLL